MENTFPAPFLQAVNAKGAGEGIVAELAVLGKAGEFDVPPTYSVIVDRISHEVGFYRAYLKSAALNGTVVIPGAQIPDLPARGRLALQHHGGKRNGQWAGPPSLLQYKNIFIKELPVE